LLFIPSVPASEANGHVLQTNAQPSVLLRANSSLHLMANCILYLTDAHLWLQG